MGWMRGFQNCSHLRIRIKWCFSCFLQGVILSEAPTLSQRRQSHASLLASLKRRAPPRARPRSPDPAARRECSPEIPRALDDARRFASPSPPTPWSYAAAAPR